MYVLTMHASDKLHMSKQSYIHENNIHELRKNVNALNKEVTQLKHSIQSVQNMIEEYKSETKKQCAELYAFCKKLERVYCNGLMTTIGENTPNTHDDIDFSTSESLSPFPLRS